MPRDPGNILPRQSRNWDRFRILRGAEVRDLAGNVVPLPHGTMIVALRRRGGGRADWLLVPIAEAWVDDVDIDIWPIIRERANRAWRRRIDPLAQPPPDAVDSH